jgi:hypothetical protein
MLVAPFITAVHVPSPFMVALMRCCCLPCCPGAALPKDEEEEPTPAAIAKWICRDVRVGRRILDDPRKFHGASGTGRSDCACMDMCPLL